MLSLEEAQVRLLALALPLPDQSKSLSECAGLYLAETVIARRTQPAVDLSAMDGFAIRQSEMPGPWRIIGESAAGKPHTEYVGRGDAVRIFTGAHLPKECDSVIVTEEACVQGTTLTLDGVGPTRKGMHIRSKGGDFVEGDKLLERGSFLHPGAIAVAAMAGYGELVVGGIPKVSVLASGDELLSPGEICDPAHIPSSNNVMLSAMLSTLPCTFENKGIVADNVPDFEAAILDCLDSDIIVTSGGASNGAHDLVEPVLRRIGAKIDFWKVAVRPGKPIIVGRVGNAIFVGLPGNPSSAFVTATIFLLPLIRHFSGSNTPYPALLTATLQNDLPAGGNRIEFLRGIELNGSLSVLGRQDSGMLTPLSRANVLVINSAFAPARHAGAKADFIRLF